MIHLFTRASTGFRVERYTSRQHKSILAEFRLFSGSLKSLSGTSFLFRCIARLYHVGFEHSITGQKTPAVEAGVTDRLWSLEDMVRIVDEWEAAQKLAG